MGKPFDELKKRARIGQFRETVRFFQEAWLGDPAKFGELLQESFSCWRSPEYIPMALSVFTTEHDDVNLRRVVGAVVARGRVDGSHKEALTMMPALWRDGTAREEAAGELDALVAKEIERGVPSNDLLWTLRRGVMVGWRGKANEISELDALVKKDGRDPELIGLVEALSEFHREGNEGLRERMETRLRQGKVSETDIAACFILGSTGDAGFAPLFLRLHEVIGGRDFWSESLRTRALSSLAFVTAMGPALEERIERWLVGHEKKLKSWWSGGNLRPAFMNICDIIWNFRGTPSAVTLAALQKVSCGSHKGNARNAISLLMARGWEVPKNAKFDGSDYEVKFGVDHVQYDKILNFAYYWRCSAKFSR